MKTISWVVNLLHTFFMYPVRKSNHSMIIFKIWDSAARTGWSSMIPHLLHTHTPVSSSSRLLYQVEYRYTLCSTTIKIRELDERYKALLTYSWAILSWGIHLYHRRDHCRLCSGRDSELYNISHDQRRRCSGVITWSKNVFHLLPSSPEKWVGFGGGARSCTLWHHTRRALLYADREELQALGLFFFNIFVLHLDVCFLVSFTAFSKVVNSSKSTLYHISPPIITVY